jgi:DNA-directed RNA polymerase specialized sigma24 family protein
MTITLDTVGAIGYRSPVTYQTTTTRSEPLPLPAWLRQDPDLLRRVAHRVSDALGHESADGEDAAHEAAALALTENRHFASASTLTAWLSTQAAAWLKSHRGLASAARVDVAPAHVGSPATIEAAIDASRLVAYVDGLVDDRADTLLACICGDITFSVAGAEMSLTRQRAQQCAAKLAEQVRRHQRAQEASCRR